MNTKTKKPKFSGTKTEKLIYKIAKTTKPKIPMPPSLRYMPTYLVQQAWKAKRL